jgi:hypothetical protein
MGRKGLGIDGVQSGVASIHIGWVYRVNFYRRLGYALWREFDMSWRHK